MTESIPQSQFHVDILRGGLQDRRLMTLHRRAVQTWQMIYLRHGGCDLLSKVQIDGTEPLSISGPALLCLPSSGPATLQLKAGADGIQLMIDEFGMTAALGLKPEAADLRVMTERMIVLTLEDLAQTHISIMQAFDIIVTELGGDLPGRETIVEAQLRFLLVLLWRYSYRPRETQAADPAQTLLLRRYRQLVEVHFRSRWKVAAYARELGTTPDRLHNITTNVLGRTPLQLIHQRLQHEAHTLLEKSNMTIAQVAYHLNFHSAAQFSQFFFKQQSMPPGRYRSLSRQQKSVLAQQDDTSLTDWP